MKQSEIKELSIAELQEKLGETKQSYLDLKMAQPISPLQNPIQIRSIRRTVSRNATEITKTEIQKYKSA